MIGWQVPFNETEKVNEVVESPVVWYMQFLKFFSRSYFDSLELWREYKPVLCLCMCVCVRLCECVSVLWCVSVCTCVHACVTVWICLMTEWKQYLPTAKGNFAEEITTLFLHIIASLLPWLVFLSWIFFSPSQSMFLNKNGKDKRQQQKKTNTVEVLKILLCSLHAVLILLGFYFCWWNVFDYCNIFYKTF